MTNFYEAENGYLNSINKPTQAKADEIVEEKVFRKNSENDTEHSKKVADEKLKMFLVIFKLCRIWIEKK